MFEPFHKLTTAGLKDLAVLCRQCAGSSLPPTHALQQTSGMALGDELGQSLRSLIGEGWRIEQLAEVADALAQTRRDAETAEDLFDLVLSGPEAPGIATRDTAAVVHALFAEARQEVLLVGYAIHNARPIFEPLARRMAAEPALRVWCCLDIRRPLNDTSLASEIVRRFARDFADHQWPWLPAPEVFYDPRSLESHGLRRSSLHAKCVVVDRRAALVTSANFTEAAQERNVECGVVMRNPPLAERIYRYFKGLCDTQQLRRLDVE